MYRTGEPGRTLNVGIAPSHWMANFVSDHHGHSAPFRGDIEGLRAIAVLSIILHSAGFPLTGGFTGIDVFFVISGFLVGGRAWREYDQFGTLGYGAFFARRLVRLLPGFTLVTMFTALAGWALLLPADFQAFGASIIASLLGLPNLWFYFDGTALGPEGALLPFAHLWAFGILAQFYVFLALSIFALARWRWALLFWFILIWALSLMASALLTPAHPQAAYYMLPFRIWEPMSGFLVAVWGYETGRRWRGWAALSWLGACLILLAFLFVPAGRFYPGILTLLPVLGSLLLITNGANRNPVNKLLHHPIALLIGAMSYALYLWHWPVLALSRYLREGQAGGFETLIWALVALAMGGAVWWFVEQPLRRLASARVLLGAAAGAGAITLGLGAILFAQDGLPGRFGPEVQVHLAAHRDANPDKSHCFIADDLPLDGLEVCPIGPKGAPRVLIWGDDQALSVMAGLDQAAKQAGIPAIILARPNCPPLFGIRITETPQTQARDVACTQFNKQVQQGLGRLNSVDTVVLAGRWALYASGKGIGLDAARRVSLFPTDGPGRVDRTQANLLTLAAKETVQELRQRMPKVHVLRQVPEIPMYDSILAARQAAHRAWPFAGDLGIDTSVDRTAMTVRTALADGPWQLLEETKSISFIDPWPLFCDTLRCSAIKGTSPLYTDNAHVTQSAGRLLAPVFQPIFDPGFVNSMSTGTSE